MKDIYVVYYHEFNPYGNWASHWEKELIKDITCAFTNEEDAKKYCEDANKGFAETSICWHKYKKITLDRE